MLYKDQLNRNLELGETPKRIISLVPSQTELLVDLGLEASIVGVTKFCVYPKHLRQSKRIVGGTKQVRIDKIKALQPDIILCNKEENTKELIADLETITSVHISDVNTLEDAFQLIQMYGDVFKVEQEAQRMIFKIKNERSVFKEQVQIDAKVKVAYFIWKNPWMVVGSDTFINTMLKDAGFINVFNDEKRYPEINLEHSKLQEADAILLSSEPFPFKDDHILEFQSKFPEKTIKIVDGELFSWYGSRLQKSYAYFQKLLSSIT